MNKHKGMCCGCRDDFYNHNRDGGCWMFVSARIVERICVSINEPPPYSKGRAKSYLSCYCRDWYAMIPVDDVRVKEILK